MLFSWKSSAPRLSHAASRVSLGASLRGGTMWTRGREGVGQLRLLWGLARAVGFLFSFLSTVSIVIKCQCVAHFCVGYRGGEADGFKRSR